MRWWPGRRRGAGVAVLLVVCAVATAGCGGSGVAERVAIGPSGAPSSSSASPPCPPPDAGGTAQIGWTPFVVVGGVHYQAVWPKVVLPETSLGEQVAVVRCRMADVVSDPAFQPRSGDAAFLPAGTVLREVSGYRHDFRLAAQEEGVWRAYEPVELPDAQTGADLLDVRGKVSRISLVEGHTGVGVLRTVADPTTVQRVVGAVLAAPVLTEAERQARREDIRDEPPSFVRFDLIDGTTVQRAWHVEADLFADALPAPAALRQALMP